MKKIIFSLYFVSMAAFGQTTSKQSVAAFQRDLAAQLAVTQDAISQGKTTSASHKQDEDYFFRRFWLRLRAKVGFQLPGIASAQVTPEMEFLFERNIPEGSVVYKPK